MLPEFLWQIFESGCVEGQGELGS